MPALPDSERLKKAIESTLLQMCKLGISYTDELLIEGTVGITADKQSLMLLHFSNKSHQTHDQVDTTQKDSPSIDASVYMPSTINSTTVPADSSLPPTSPSATSRDPVVPPPATSADMRLIGAEALFSLHDYLNKPSTSYGDKLQAKDKEDLSEMQTKMSLGFPDTISIDIDSENESFGGLHFDDYDDDDCDKGKVFDSLDTDKSHDSKNIIVINDDHNPDFLGPRGEDPSLGFGTDHFSLGSQFEKPVHFGIATKNLRALEEAVRMEEEENEEIMKKGTFRATHRKPKLLVCEVCGREFTNNGLLEAHLVGAHAVTETKKLGKITHFQCKFCKKIFRYQATLNKHIIRHNNSGVDRSHRCALCKNAYRTDESLKIHQVVHDVENEDSYGATGHVLECKLCEKQYSSKVLFQKHIVYMHEIKREAKASRKRTRETEEEGEIEEKEVS